MKSVGGALASSVLLRRVVPCEGTRDGRYLKAPAYSITAEGPSNGTLTFLATLQNLFG